MEEPDLIDGRDVLDEPVELPAEILEDAPDVGPAGTPAPPEEEAPDEMRAATPALPSDGTPALSGEDTPEAEDPPNTEPAQADPQDGPQDAAPAATVEIDVTAVVEAVLFATDAPLSGAKLAAIADTGTARDVRKHVEALNDRYARMGAAFRIEEIAGGYQMHTLPEYDPWVSKLHKVRSEGKLTGAALETLSIIAYKQPALRADIEAIRGVSSGEVLRSLMEKGLVKVVGYAEVLGRPRQYGTTKRFLEVFGLRDLADLPKVSELKPPQ